MEVLAFLQSNPDWCIDEKNLNIAKKKDNPKLSEFDQRDFSATGAIFHVQSTKINLKR